MRPSAIRVVVADPADVVAEAVLRPVGEGWDGVTPAARRMGLRAGDDVLERLRVFGEAPVGAALVTPGGGLAAAFVIHVVIRSREEPVSEGGVARALRNGLRQAAGWEVGHLVVPPLGTGAGNLDPEAAARLFCEGLRAHTLETEHPREVTIAVATGFEEEAFRREIERVFGGPAPAGRAAPSDEGRQ